jgi:hypothetical protein
MAIDRRQLMNLCESLVENVDERVDGYRERLLRTAEEIYLAERDHKIRSTYIQKDVNSLCEDLADYIVEEGVKKQ